MDKEHLERAIRHQNRIEGIAEGRAECIAEVTGIPIEEIRAL